MTTQRPLNDQFPWITRADLQPFLTEGETIEQLIARLNIGAGGGWRGIALAISPTFPNISPPPGRGGPSQVTSGGQGTQVAATPQNTGAGTAAGDTRSDPGLFGSGSEFGGGGVAATGPVTTPSNPSSQDVGRLIRDIIVAGQQRGEQFGSVVNRIVAGLPQGDFNSQFQALSQFARENNITTSPVTGTTGTSGTTTPVGGQQGGGLGGTQPTQGTAQPGGFGATSATTGAPNEVRDFGLDAVGPVNINDFLGQFGNQISFDDVVRQISSGSGLSSSLQPFLENVISRQTIPFALSLAGSNDIAGQLEDPNQFRNFIGNQLGNLNISGADILRQAQSVLGGGAGPGRDFIQGLFEGPSGSRGSEFVQPIIDTLTQGSGSRFLPGLGNRARGSTARFLEGFAANDPTRFTNPLQFIDFLGQQGFF